MDPTQIKPGERTTSLPVPAGPSATEPYQRAPTLMAGATAGSQGKVRVWGPRKRDLWMRVAAAPVVMLALAYWFGVRTLGPFIFLILQFGLVVLGASIAALYRPCYITTDDAGIGITTWKGSRALRWNEIRSLFPYTRYGQVSLKLGIVGSKTPLELNLAGYPVLDREELIFILRKRAGLVLAPGGNSRYVRERDVPFEAGCFNSLGIVLGLTSSGGLRLLWMPPGAPAGVAGLLPGDEILEINDQPVALFFLGNELLWQPGTTITALVRRTRDDLSENLRCRIMTRSLLDRSGKLRALEAPRVSAEMLLSRDVDGRLIVEALGFGASGAANNAGIQPGDEILDINGLAADTISLEQARAELSGPRDSTVTLIVRDGAAICASRRSVTLRLQ